MLTSSVTQWVDLWFYFYYTFDSFHYFRIKPGRSKEVCDTAQCCRWSAAADSESASTAAATTAARFNKPSRLSSAPSSSPRCQPSANAIWRPSSGPSCCTTLCVSPYSVAASCPSSCWAPTTDSAAGTWPSSRRCSPGFGTSICSSGGCSIQYANSRSRKCRCCISNEWEEFFVILCSTI